MSLIFIPVWKPLKILDYETHDMKDQSPFHRSLPQESDFPEIGRHDGLFIGLEK